MYSNEGCSRCQNGYSATNQGLCVITDPNCLEYDGTTCSRCKDNFVVFDGKCVMKDEYCKVYEQNGMGCK